MRGRKRGAAMHTQHGDAQADGEYPMNHPGPKKLSQRLDQMSAGWFLVYRFRADLCFFRWNLLGSTC